MRVNALVVDLALLNEEPWHFLDRVSAALPGLGVVVCTGRTSVAQRVRGLRAGADDWVTKPCHPEEVLARVEAVVRRRKRASARVETGPLVAGELEIRADQFQAFAGRHQRGSHPARVRGAAAARPDRGQGAPARGDLPGRVGLRHGPRRPLGGRVRAQGAPEAREGLARLGLHAHALRRRLPLPAGASGWGRGRPSRSSRPAIALRSRSTWMSRASPARTSRCSTRASRSRSTPASSRAPRRSSPRRSRGRGRVLRQAARQQLPRPLPHQPRGRRADRPRRASARRRRASATAAVRARAHRRPRARSGRPAPARARRGAPPRRAVR